MTSHRRYGLALLCLIAGGAHLAGCRAPQPKESAAEGEQARAAVTRGPAFYKGQLHAHSANSGDSYTPVSQVLDWYGEHDFDFVVITDHNVITVPPAHPKVLGITGLELTNNLKTCTPAPPPDAPCILHINALFLTSEETAAVTLTPGSDERRAIFEHSMALGLERGGLLQLNHPNFHYAADADDVAHLAQRGLTFLEIANMASDSNNEGDATHPSTVAMWDDVLSRGIKIYGVATDDAHHYYDARPGGARPPHYVGDLGYVMVRASSREPKALRAALASGDFYSSTGVRLRDFTHDAARHTLTLEAEPADGLQISLIADGELLETVKGSKARFELGGIKAHFARVELVDGKGERAWLQPMVTGEPPPAR